MDPKNCDNQYVCKLEPDGVTSKNFPILRGLGMTEITLQKNQLLTPHLHPNANELAYFISGTAQSAVISPNPKDPPSTPFEVNAGDVVFFPQGFIHYVDNIGEDPVKFILTFDNPDFDLLPVTVAFKSLPSSILAKTFDVTAQEIEASFQNGGVIVPPYPQS